MEGKEIEMQNFVLIFNVLLNLLILIQFNEEHFWFCLEATLMYFAQCKICTASSKSLNLLE